MNAFRRSQLSDHVLLQSCREHVSRERRAMAELLADLAEVDARRLYAPAGYSSLYAWCVGELKLSEDAAYKRIQAARAAREFPLILPAIAEGRLHLAAVCLLAPRLTRENAEDLVTAAVHRTKDQIEEMLAARFPRPDVPTQLVPAIGPATSAELAPGQVIFTPTEQVAAATPRATPLQAEVAIAAPPTRVAPLAPGRYELRGTLDADAHADLRTAQELLGVHGGDAIAVIAKALKLLRRDLERRRCGAADRPREQRRAPSGRAIPRAVRRKVWKRDGGQCSFVAGSGHRCEERRGLQYHHVISWELGGESTVPNLQLRCHAHNQYEADRTFGRAFMDGKREAARDRELRREQERAARREVRAAAASQRDADAKREAELRERACEVIPWLRELGFRAEEARRAAERSAHMTDAPIEERVRVALQGLAPPRARHVAAGG